MPDGHKAYVLKAVTKINRESSLNGKLLTKIKWSLANSATDQDCNHNPPRAQEGHIHMSYISSCSQVLGRAIIEAVRPKSSTHSLNGLRVDSNISFF